MAQWLGGSITIHLRLQGKFLFSSFKSFASVVLFFYHMFCCLLSSSLNHSIVLFGLFDLKAGVTFSHVAKVVCLPSSGMKLPKLDNGSDF